MAVRRVPVAAVPVSCLLATRRMDTMTTCGFVEQVVLTEGLEPTLPEV